MNSLNPIPVMGVDPGNERTAYVLFDGQRVIDCDIVENVYMLTLPARHQCERMAIEGVACYGMPVGKETFDTCIWIGRFIQNFGPGASDIIYRGEVKMHLCRNMRAKDANIRQALIDRFGPGKDAAIGKKKAPGPLYGVKSHCWSALAVAVTWWDTRLASMPNGSDTYSERRDR